LSSLVVNWQGTCNAATKRMMDVGMMKDSKERTDEKENFGRAVRLAQLVDYQEGSVVSRTIVDKKGGTVTLFAFDEAEGLSEHTAPFDALVYLVDGEAEVTISGKPMSLKEGEMVVMPANKPHALRAVKRFKMILVMIRS
jgi:quercetin dioxygenase-like cupin family protein